MSDFPYFSLSVIALLAATFIALKLTQVIDWSWGWVLSPLWVPFVTAIAVLAFEGLNR